jgi:hypothetical protein
MYISTGQGDVLQQRNLTGRSYTSVQDKEMYCSKGISQFLYIIYSQKEQVKYIADTRLQGRNQEKHMVI